MSQPVDVTEQNILELTPHVLRLLDDWQLNDAAICTLLGMDAECRARDLRRFRQQVKALPFSAEMVERIGHLIGIDAALRTAYPHNGRMGAFWLRQPHRRFGQQPPIRVMLEDGLSGLTRVHVEVDCAYGWSLTDQRNWETS